MKKFILLTLTAFLFVGYAEAQNPLRAGSFAGNVGQVKQDSIRWLASGAIPGTKGLITDTLAGSTLNDTTIAYDIAGAEYVSVALISRSKNDDMDFTIEAQVGPTDHPTGVWNSLQGTYSVANTAGAEVGGTADTGRDTLIWVLKHDPTYPDTTAGFVGNINKDIIIPGRADMIQTAANRWLRFWIDPDGAAATDSTFIKGIITRIYPR